MLKSAIVREVRSLFHDASRGEGPVQRSDRALFARDSVVWRVHADVTGMMTGGIAALLLQMLHPAALAGVWDHSDFRADRLGRLRRTARFIAVTTFAEREAALAAIDRVRAIHERVTGTLADGTAYRASDPRLLAWVHACEALCFLDGWRRYGEPGMSRADQDRYFAEFAGVAERLGADPVPKSRAEAERLIAGYRAELVCDARTREVVRLLMEPPRLSAQVRLFQDMTFQAGVDLLPRWARELHGFAPRPLGVPLTRAGTLAMARTLRWAFRA